MKKSRDTTLALSLDYKHFVSERKSRIVSARLPAEVMTRTLTSVGCPH